MTLKNQDARKLLNALEILRAVQSVDLSLERSSLCHKIQALLTKQRSEDMTESELIADMDDDELAYAIAVSDKRIGDIMNPFLFNHLRVNRPMALVMSDELRKKGVRG